MMNPALVYLKCRISRGAFSEERVFRVSLDREKFYEGVADREYCFTQEKTPVAKDKPSGEETINGFVAARILRREQNQVLVSVPDGSVIWVAKHALASKEASLAPPSEPLPPYHAEGLSGNLPAVEKAE